MNVATKPAEILEDTPLFPYERYESRVEDLAKQYAEGRPVPHMHFSDFLEESVARALEAEFPGHDDQTWIQYKHVNENKAGLHERDKLPRLIGKIVDELNSPRFVALLSKLTGIPDLVADPTIEGGGMHQSTAGGFLNVHTDFTMHRRIPKWRRRCNIILYLNEGWEADWGGNIDFWASDMSERLGSYPVSLNCALIFSTPGARHGYPDPMTCPADRSRKSIQWYFYTIDAEREVAPHATTYFARPEDRPMHRFMIRLDNALLGIYSWLKRRLGISDALISRVLGKLGGK